MQDMAASAMESVPVAALRRLGVPHLKCGLLGPDP